MRPRIDSEMPFRSSPTASGSKPIPRSRTNSDTDFGSTSPNSDNVGAPDHLARCRRLLARQQAVIATLVEGTVAHDDDLDGYPVERLDLALDAIHSCGEAGVLATSRARCFAVEQPRAELTFLCSRQLDDLLGLVCLSLYESEGLEHRVVDARCQLGALLGSGSGLALHDELPRHPQPHGPKTVTMAAITSRSPSSGRKARPEWPRLSTTSRTPARRASPSTRATVRPDRPEPSGCCVSRSMGAAAAVEEGLFGRIGVSPHETRPATPTKPVKA